MHVVDGVEMVDVREAAALAHRSPETIRRWVWSGKVNAIKYGTKLLVPRVAVAPPAPSEPPHQLTLSEWIAWSDGLRSARATGPGQSAADLILEDRDERGGRAGD